MMGEERIKSRVGSGWVVFRGTLTKVARCALGIILASRGTHVNARYLSVYIYKQKVLELQRESSRR